MKNFTREELQDLRERAKDRAGVGHLNASWKRAYLRLADAAATLDAFIARTEVFVEEARK